MIGREVKVTDVWEKYQLGIEHHNEINLYTETDRNWNFYIGNQWNGLKVKGKDYAPPSFNIIKPMVKIKATTVSLQKKAIVYSDIENVGKEENVLIMQALTKFAEREWEYGKLDTIIGEMTLHACITGDSYLYCRDTRTFKDSIIQDLKPRIEHQIINCTNIYLSDEQQKDLNKQEYIIIADRISVTEARSIAKKNEIAKDKISLIVSDEELTTEVGSPKEVKSKNGKCTVLLYFAKKDGKIEYKLSTQAVEIEQAMLPIDVYPIVSFRWEDFINTARGISAVKYVISNQIEINYNLYRRLTEVKNKAFPITVCDENAISNIQDIGKPGAKIKIKNMAQNPVRNVFDYVSPPATSADASNIQQELQSTTQSLEGAGDAITGQVNPEKASGEAIKTARDQAALPLNEQSLHLQQTIEDLARLWFKMWVGYSPNGLQITVDDENFVVNTEMLQGIEPYIKVDITPIDPYSVRSEDDMMFQLMQSGQITFDEWVEALGINTTMPKAKLKNILSERVAREEEQMQQMLQQGGGINAVAGLPQEAGQEQAQMYLQ